MSHHARASRSALASVTRRVLGILLALSLLLVSARAGADESANARREFLRKGAIGVGVVGGLFLAGGITLTAMGAAGRLDETVSNQTSPALYIPGGVGILCSILMGLEARNQKNVSPWPSPRYWD
jgi:uncharacterized membrane protein YfcA